MCTSFMAVKVKKKKFLHKYIKFCFVKIVTDKQTMKMLLIAPSTFWLWTNSIKYHMPWRLNKYFTQKY